MGHNIEIKKQAENLYEEGMSYRDIAKKVKVKSHITIKSWCEKHNWQKGEKGKGIEDLQIETLEKLLVESGKTVNEKKALKPNAESKRNLSNYIQLTKLHLKYKELQQKKRGKLKDNDSHKKKLISIFK